MTDELGRSSDPCTCGHAREAHEHYRRGSDCGICGREVCSQFVRDPQAASPSSPSPATLTDRGSQAHTA